MRRRATSRLRKFGARTWAAHAARVHSHGCVTLESAHALALGMGHGLWAMGGPKYPWGCEIAPNYQQLASGGLSYPRGA